MRKSIVFALIAVIFIACNGNDPTIKYVGAWEVVEGEDTFIITKDSIKAIQNGTGLEHYQSHYTIIRNGVAELERCWMEEEAKNHEPSEYWHPELYFFDEVQIYFDKDGFLIIDPFDIPDYLSNKFPNYSRLILKRK